MKEDYEEYNCTIEEVKNSIPALGIEDTSTFIVNHLISKIETLSESDAIAVAKLLELEYQCRRLT